MAETILNERIIASGSTAVNSGTGIIASGLARNGNETLRIECAISGVSIDNTHIVVLHIGCPLPSAYAYPLHGHGSFDPTGIDELAVFFVWRGTDTIDLTWERSTLDAGSVTLDWKVIASA